MRTLKARPFASKIRNLFSAAAVATALVSADARADDPAPDLLALGCNGPGQAQIGQSVGVNVFIVNLGGPFAGPYSARVYLSADTVIDGSDIVLGTVNNAVIGAQTLFLEIPDGIQPGTYNLALQIDPVAGETALFNNEIIGNQIHLFTVDLQVLNGDPVSVNALKDGNDPSTHVIQVTNGGSADGILVFTTTVIPPAPWLSVSPTSSFALPNQPPQKINLDFHVAGVLPGTYQTNVVFSNFFDSDDYTIVPVSLTIGEAHFNPGDRLIGGISSPTDRDEALFDGVAGEILRLRVKAQGGDLKPTVTVLDSTDQVIKSFTVKKSGKVTKKSIKLPTSGEFRVRVEGSLGTQGDYTVMTGRKLPKKAKSYTVTVGPNVNGVMAEIPVLGLPDGTLDVVVKPMKNFPATPEVALNAPGGSPIDISANSEALANRNVLVTDVVFLSAGEYSLQITGFGSAKEKVKVTLIPTPPALGNATVLLP